MPPDTQSPPDARENDSAPELAWPRGTSDTGREGQPADGLSLPAHDSISTGSALPSAPLPEVHDRYERRLVLGEGGMGRVTLVHDRLLGRDVALKEPLPGRLGDALRVEASLNARLEHPAVVPVYDGHRGQDGRFAYTMRLLRGRSLERVLAEPGLDLSARRGLLRHLLVASQAVAWAHAHGVVHRDLKPSNIMVGEFGETQVVDWGLAQSVAAAEQGAVSGTPYYMSPEQAVGHPADTRSDVYALGLILYEVATGRRGRPGEGTDKALSAARAGLGPAREPSLPSDLWAVIQRATAADAAQRYSDAQAFAHDLAAWLDGRRVSAHEYSSFELLSRLVAAWRVPLAVAFIALVIGGIAVGLSLSEAASQRDLARAERAVAEGARAAATEARRSAEAELARSLVFSARARLDAGQPYEALVGSLDAMELLEQDTTDSKALLEARGVLLSAASSPPATILELGELPAHERWLPGPGPGRGVAITGDRVTLWNMANGERVWSVSASEALSRPDQAIEWVVARPTGVVVGAGGQLPFAVDGETGALRETLALPFRGRLVTVGDDLLVIGWNELTLQAGSEPPQTVLAVCREQVAALDAAILLALCRDGRFHVWGREAEGPLTSLFEGHLKTSDIEPASVALRSIRREAKPTQRGAITGEMVIGTTRGELLIADPATGALNARIPVGEGVVSQVEVSPDGRYAALLDEREGVALVDLASRTALGRLPASVASGFRFEDGSTLVTWGADRWARWDLQAQGPRPFDAGQGVTAVGWGADLIAYTASRRQALHSIDGAPLDTLDTPFVVKGLALLPLAPGCDGDAPAPLHLATAGVGFSLRLAGPPPYETLIQPRITPSNPMVRRLAAVRTSARGPCEWMALALTDHGALTLSDASGAAIWDRPADTRGLDLAVSGDGRLAIASVGAAMQPVAITTDPLPSAMAVPMIRGCSAVAVAPSAEQLFACAQERTITIADLDGRPIAWLPVGLTEGGLSRGPAGGHLTELSWSPDGRLLAFGTRLGQTHIWSAPSRQHRGQAIAILSDHRERVAALAWDPSSRWLISGSWDRLVRPRDLSLLELSSAGLRSRLSGLLAVGVDR